MSSTAVIRKASIKTPTTEQGFMLGLITKRESMANADIYYNVLVSSFVDGAYGPGIRPIGIDMPHFLTMNAP